MQLLRKWTLSSWFHDKRSVCSKANAKQRIDDYLQWNKFDSYWFGIRTIFREVMFHVLDEYWACIYAH